MGKEVFVQRVIEGLMIYFREDKRQIPQINKKTDKIRRILYGC